MIHSTSTLSSMLSALPLTSARPIVPSSVFAFAFVGPVDVFAVDGHVLGLGFDFVFLPVLPTSQRRDLDEVGLKSPPFSSTRPIVFSAVLTQ